MENLIRLLKDVEKLLHECNRCGTCQAVCPVFYETRMESDVARGKLALLDGMLRNLLQNPEPVLHQLHRCVMCGSCAHRCPAGVRVLEIFFRSRAVLSTFQEMPWWKRFLIQNVLSREKQRIRWAALARLLESGFRKPAGRDLGTSCARWMSPILRDQHLIRLAKNRFRVRADMFPKPVNRKKPSVLFFTGCLLEHVFPHVAEASIRALNFHGYEVLFAKTTACCGLPALAVGDEKTFRDQIQQNVEAVREMKFTYMITACATCLYTIRQLWPMWTQGGERNSDEIISLSAKTRDISEILAMDASGQSPVASNQNTATIVTYHDPCHLKKSMGIERQPRQLLQASTGYRFQEMNEPDRCCGMGGLFHLEHAALSRQIGRKKRDLVLSSNSRVVATGCPACMIQLAEIFSAHGDAVQVKHTVEIYAEHLKCQIHSPGGGSPDD